MIRTVNIDGKEMTAVILGDDWSVDISEYLNALFEMMEAAMLNPETTRCGFFNGSELFTYTRLIRAFYEEPIKKGGKV